MNQNHSDTQQPLRADTNTDPGIGVPADSPFGEDLSGLISAAINAAGEEELDPDSECTVDGWTEPTATVVSFEEAARAREAFSAARTALSSGQLEHARAMMEEAQRLDPTDVRVPGYLDEIAAEERRMRRKAESQQASAALLARQREIHKGSRTRLLVAGGVLLALVVARAGVHISSGPEPAVDVSEAFQEVASFSALSQAPNGTWMAIVAEPLDSMGAEARQARCQEIAEQLPSGDSGMVLLRSTDGGSMVCGR